MTITEIAEMYLDGMVKCMIVAISISYVGHLYTDIDKVIPKVILYSFWIMLFWAMLPIIKAKIKSWKYLLGKE